jgi:AcrR family transcriptional regulator
MNAVKMSHVSNRRPTDRYHHGDLRNALIGAAIALAREGGPDAVVLREVARRVDVSAAAAYHHFASHEEMVQAVKYQALAMLTEEMRSALRDTGDAADVPVAARGRLRALGAAYFRFASNEPGLFRLAFSPRGAWPTGESTGSGDAAEDPFALLSQVLDELAGVGVITAERRPGLEYVLWAAVHGTAVLCLDGPLARFDAAEREQMLERVLDTTIRGL